MEITEIYSHIFLAKISWKQRFYKRTYWTVDFTVYFFSESKFHVFLHCGLLWPSLIYFTCLVVMSSPLTFLHFLPSYFFFFIYFVYQVHLMNSYKTVFIYLHLLINYWHTNTWIQKWYFTKQFTFINYLTDLAFRFTKNVTPLWKIQVLIVQQKKKCHISKFKFHFESKDHCSFYLKLEFGNNFKKFTIKFFESF